MDPVNPQSEEQNENENDQQTKLEVVEVEPEDLLEDQPETPPQENSPSSAPSESAPPEQNSETVEIKSESEKKKPSPFKIILIVLIVTLVIGLVGGGIYVYQKAMGKTKPPSAPEPSVQTFPTSLPTEAPSLPSPTPTPAIELDRADLKLQVLNGSGTPGLAGEAQEYLEGLGYQDVDTGNAASYDYEETEIAIKEDKEEYLNLLIEDLSEEYTLATDTAILDEDSQYDAVVTIGKK